ncbi:tripartite motif-containing protein 45 isoform X3 [Aethina tumida]|uniref:tripartite motif-containing protein 45 isoform X1 n=1 Tax=Aethina tumida TaxID=116153 RepID=UPI002148D767|nr:tripartite motif-containing protein 45 isoform X1 [Aethina tumida]XP_049822439.1 tripartite motif-containing protein 45 isoform X2 [Aethina tumida]XP_049822440.1 tripartite motif-containing protein 45 isoform X3 [Aethina tumida]
MLEFDRMSYIFGSFARRRQSHEVSSAKRRSIEPPPKIVHDRSKSTPHTKKTVTISTPRAKSVYNVALNDGQFKCSMCLRQYVDPRVLPCLHSFCLRCLQELESGSPGSWQEADSPKTSSSPDSRKASSSGGSGYVSDKHEYKSLCCPSCGTGWDIPDGGVGAFPPNYTLQHKMVVASLSGQGTHLCDVCTTDVTATSRCTDCALSFCHACEELHLRQKLSENHEVLSLEDARRRGITRIRRQIMCIRHPELELSIFCSTCSQVICRECITSHRGHTCEPVSRVAKSQITNLRHAVDKAKAVMEQSAVAANKLHLNSKKIEAQCGKVQMEVEKFIENYIKSVEDHKTNLLEQIQQVKEEKIESINQEKVNLQKRINEARDLAYFLDDLLREGTDVEMLRFVKPVMEKMNRCTSDKSFEVRLSGSLIFLPEEAVPCSNNFMTLYGVLSTQSVSAQHCLLNTDGLMNLRVGKQAEAILETRDYNDIPLDRGGEMVMAEIRYRDAGVSRCLNVMVDDRRDGTYSISFVPDVAGKLVLSVFIKGEAIKNNPFPFVVRSLKPHHGTFHCCTFCSSGGSKEASCGCGGNMPGGYKGCGHGHEGHPGKRHWSCCGNILEHSECSKSNSHYQFTL